MKIFIFVIIILVLGTVVYFVVYHPNQILAPGISSSPSVSVSANMHTYRNSQFGFQFNYPDNFSSVEPTNYFLKDPIVQFRANSDKYPKTDLDDYSFTVSTGSDTANCTWGIEGGPNAGQPLRYKISINGVLFYKDTISDAGAGNFYDSLIYRTIRESKCFEVAMTIHTSNIDNYPSEAGIKEIDKSKIWAELDQLLNSFKFTK